MSLALDGSLGITFPSGSVSNGLVSTTAVATTSGTSVVLATGIPSTVKRISVILNGVGTSGTAGYLIQIGPSGSYTSSGYVGGGGRTGNANGVSNSSSAGFLINSAASGGAKNIILTIDLMNTSYGYVCAGSGFSGSETNQYVTGGAVTLSGPLAQVQITTTNGTDTFTAGSIGVIYE